MRQQSDWDRDPLHQYPPKYALFIFLATVILWGEMMFGVYKVITSADDRGLSDECETCVTYDGR